jgi:hypothetical protein
MGFFDFLIDDFLKHSPNKNNGKMGKGERKLEGVKDWQG